jgi:hypothetical protein
VLRRIALVHALLLSLTLACGGPRAYVDWRPGLGPIDFDGVFELSLDEYEGYADRSEPHTLFDVARSITRPEAATTLTALGDRLGAGVQEPYGWALLHVEGDGRAKLLDDGARELAVQTEWFAITPDGQRAALRSGTKLAVVFGQASAGIELGSLLGEAAGWHFMMMAEGDELTVFALPEVGGVVTANEPGYLFSFRHHPGARKPWDITVARVSIRM